jgi:hypothetical protein
MLIIYKYIFGRKTAQPAVGNGPRPRRTTTAEDKLRNRAGSKIKPNLRSTPLAIHSDWDFTNAHRVAGQAGVKASVVFVDVCCIPLILVLHSRPGGSCAGQAAHSPVIGRYPYR